MSEWRPDLATVMQLGIALAAVAVSWGINAERLDGHRQAIDDLRRDIERERAERLAERAGDRQERMVWLMQRSSRRLDIDLADTAKLGAARAPSP